MSVYLQIDDTVGPIQIASNVGYGEFGGWVDSLDIVKYHDLICLYEHGWCQNVANLIGELGSAITDHASPSEDVMDVATTLAGWLDGEEDAVVVTITDGFGDGNSGSKSVPLDPIQAVIAAARLAVQKAVKDTAHAPAGSSIGGQFVSQGGGGAAEKPEVSAEDKPTGGGKHGKDFKTVDLKHKAPKATLDAIDKKLQLTDAQKIETAAKLKSLAADAHMFTRVSILTLPLIAESGRFKTQFETGKSAAAFNPDMRSNAESNGLGTPKDSDPKERPFYAYMHSDPSGGDICASYGSVKIKFKDQIRPRCTMAVGDSLGGMLDKSQAGMPLNDPTHHVLGRATIDTVKNAKKIEDLASHSFTEIQAHGGLSMDDVETIIVPKRLASPEFEAMKKKHLDPRGIKVEYTEEAAPAAKPAAKPSKPGFFSSLFGKK